MILGWVWVRVGIKRWLWGIITVGRKRERCLITFWERTLYIYWVFFLLEFFFSICFIYKNSGMVSIEVSPVLTVCDGVRPVGPVSVITVQYNSHIWEELSLLILLWNGDTKGGFLCIGIRLVLFFNLFIVIYLYGVLWTGVEEFW